MTTTEIEDKIYNIELLVEDIRNFPQTYSTILKKDKYSNSTIETILRRKLSNLCKQGVLCKASIPGTRFGQVIFYTIPKKYYIVAEGDRLGVELYVFFEFEKKSNNWMFVPLIYRLKNGAWEEVKEKYLFQGKILMML